jgi:CDP-glycerol glycerophosphotransferase (TagB/SpsB family)
MWAYFMDRFGDIDLKPQLHLGYKLAEQYEHIKLVEPEIYNIVPLYKLADILMTDASSTIYEIIALEKPVIVNRFLKLKLSHIFFRSRLYRKRLNDEMNRDISKFCFELQSPKDLPSILETAFKENDQRLDVIRKYQKKMLFKLDGQASIRVRDRILDRLN